jgi:hypothetical protein
MWQIVASYDRKGKTMTTSSTIRRKPKESTFDVGEIILVGQILPPGPEDRAKP